MSVTFGSLCSGIEAASLAWNSLGWKASWLAEIDPFACKLLAYRYPDVPNFGDMRKIPALLRNGTIYPPDVLAGGTPCQAFSLAGLRNSLNDARGNLSMTFCEIADEIDIQRRANGLLPCIIKWENVPGVLTTKDNAFGCFLAGLAGADEALVPEPCPDAGTSSRYWKWNKKKHQHTLSWPRSGCVLGPTRAIAWRVLDAQFFGLAQRRKRVYVVGSARAGFDSAEVLLEFDGVRRDTAPRRDSPQDTAGTVRASAGRRGGIQDECGLGLQPVVATLDASYGRLQGCSGQDATHGHSLLVPVAFGGNNQTGPIDVATACRAHASPHLDFESETFLVQAAPIAFDSRQEPVFSSEVFGSLGASSPQAQAVTYPIQNALRSGSQNGLGIGIPGDPMYTLDRAAQHAVCVTGDITHTLKAEGFDASEDGTGRGQPIVAHAIQAGALRTNPAGGPDGVGVQAEVAYTLEARSEVQCVQMGMAVRRLTPRECERLQGASDDYTLIPVRKVTAKRAAKLRAKGEPVAVIDGEYWKLADDGPRYKALGNSWAIPKVRWIGQRIDRQLHVDKNGKSLNNKDSLNAP